MPYAIAFTSAARRQFEKLDPPLQRRISPFIDELARQPRLPGARAMQGESKVPRYRIRIGSYRVIYEIHDRDLLVKVVAAGHRKEVYR